MQAQQTQQKLSRTTIAAEDARVRVTDEEAFDSVRQAALVMFKQRTKDLTRLAHVEAQTQKLDTELQLAQTSVAQLSLQQAALEALVAEEEQRTRQREQHLAGLHGALVQADEEHRSCQKLQRAATHAIDAAASFISHFASSEGRLFQLLAVAKERLVGRTARDFEALLRQIQERHHKVQQYQQRLLCVDRGACYAEEPSTTSSEPAVPAPRGAITADATTTLHTLLTEWVCVRHTWAGHREVADLCDLLQEMFEWNSAMQAASPEAVFDVDKIAPASGGPPLPPCPFPSFTADDTFFTITIAPETEEFRTQDALFETPDAARIQRYVTEAVLVPFQTFAALQQRLSSACAVQTLPLPPEIEEGPQRLCAACEEWTAILAQRQQWATAQKSSKSAVEAAAVAKDERDATRAAVAARMHACAEQQEQCARRTEELQKGGEAALHNYAAAWARAWTAWGAQRASLLHTQDIVQLQEEERRQIGERAAQEEAASAPEMQERQSLLREKEAQLQEAQAQLSEAMERKATLEEELAVAQRTQQEVREHLEKMMCHLRKQLRKAFHAPEQPANAVNGGVLSAFETPPSEDDAAACVTRVLTGALHLVGSLATSSPSCPATLKEWAAQIGCAMRGEGSQADTDDDVTAFADVLSRAGEGVADVDSKSFTFVLLHVGEAVRQAAAAQHLPPELFQANPNADLLKDVVSACWEDFALMMAAAQKTRAEAPTHRTFMADAEAEMALLRRELSAET